MASFSERPAGVDRVGAPSGVEMTSVRARRPGPAAISSLAFGGATSSSTNSEQSNSDASDKYRRNFDWPRSPSRSCPAASAAAAAAAAHRPTLSGSAPRSSGNGPWDTFDRSR